jgi:hypothetical protein
MQELTQYKIQVLINAVTGQVPISDSTCPITRLGKVLSGTYDFNVSGLLNGSGLFVLAQRTGGKTGVACWASSKLTEYRCAPGPYGWGQ